MYISIEKTKKIRQELKKQFPFMKFSVRNFDYRSVKVCVMESPFDFNGATVRDGVDQRWFQGSEEHTNQEKEFIGRIVEIIKDIGDYTAEVDHCNEFTCSFGFEVSIGKYDKPYQKVNKVPNDLFCVATVTTNLGNELMFNVTAPQLKEMANRVYYSAYLIMKENEYPVSSSYTLGEFDHLLPTFSASTTKLRKSLNESLCEETKQKLKNYGLL